jgi:hypothetical protein
MAASNATRMSAGARAPGKVQGLLTFSLEACCHSCLCEPAAEHDLPSGYGRAGVGLTSCAQDLIEHMMPEEAPAPRAQTLTAALE